MPSETKFPSGLNNWGPEDRPKREDFNADNEIIDASLKTLSDLASGRNLLHNWYYNRPINQRNISGTFSTAGAYFIDRWKLIEGSVTLTANGLTLNGTIAQILEYAVGSDVFASVKMYSGDAAALYNDTTRTFTITSSGGTIESAKLEKGTFSTLVNDPPMDYGAELAVCQRYQRRLSTGSSVMLRAARIATNDIFFALPFTMRANPIITQIFTLSSPSPALYNGASATEVAGFSYAVEYATNNSTMRIRATKAAHGLTDANIDLLGCLLDANL